MLLFRAPLAQLDRASGYEPEGREFESLRAHHSTQALTESGSTRNLGPLGPLTSFIPALDAASKYLDSAGFPVPGYEDSLSEGLRETYAGKRLTRLSLLHFRPCDLRGITGERFFQTYQSPSYRSPLTDFREESPGPDTTGVPLSVDVRRGQRLGGCVVVGSAGGL